MPFQKKKKAILEIIAFATVASSLLWTKDRAFCCCVEWFSCSAYSCMNIQLPLWAPVVAREGKVGGILIMLQLWFFHCPFPFFWKLSRLEGSHYWADHDSMYSLINMLRRVWMNNARATKDCLIGGSVISHWPRVWFLSHLGDWSIWRRNRELWLEITISDQNRWTDNNSSCNPWNIQVSQTPHD